MKIKESFVLIRRDGQNFIECTDKNNTLFNTSLSLNTSAAFLFRQLKKKPQSKEELLKALLDMFEISTVLALNDIDMFIKILKKNGILEE